MNSYYCQEGKTLSIEDNTIYISTTMYLQDYDQIIQRPCQYRRGPYHLVGPVHQV
jgi:hypothetical protein